MTLITGSSRGIGKAIARRFIYGGQEVVIHGTRMDSPRLLGEHDGDMESLARDLGASWFIGDLGHPGAVPEKLGRKTDILICCAGGDIGHEGVYGEMAGRPRNNDPLHIAPADTETLVRRNILTTVYTCQAVVPHMLTRMYGTVILIGSMNVALKLPEGSIYSACKAAVHHYTRTLAEHCRPYNVQVNCLAPGSTVTARFKASRTWDGNRVGRGLHDYALPEEIAIACWHLAHMPHTTGQIVYVDGGQA